VYRKTGAKANNYVSISQLMRAAQTYGVTFDYFYDWKIDTLIDNVRRGKAIMVLVHYGAWSQIEPGISTQNSFTGPHFVVVSGADEEHIYVNDPLWTGARRSDGFRHPWTYEEFSKAWNTCNLDGNRNCSGIVSQNALETSPFGSGGWAPVQEAMLNPLVLNRIRAWSLYLGGTDPILDNIATINAYTAAMGNWGAQRARHIVAENDDLSTIALQYYGDPLKWPAILAYNGLVSADIIADGDILYIPEPLSHEVNATRPEGTVYRHLVWQQKEKIETSQLRSYISY
jgi:hypothetical protein